MWYIYNDIAFLLSCLIYTYFKSLFHFTSFL